MYFLNQDERRYLLKGLLARARTESVAEELRGWNWDRPPLEPAHDSVPLGVAEVASGYCPTARDLYLRRVLDVHGEPSAAMRSGQALHGVLAEVITRAKRLLYHHGADGWRAAMEELAEAPPMSLEARELWAFEARRIAARVEEVVSRHPHIQADALVALAIPVVVEQRLDGTPLGLSGSLTVDALMLGEPMVFDIKFGEPRDFHALSLAGYALVLEATYEYPVNLGCLVYATFRDGRWTVDRRFHLLGDSLRQWFVEERDEKQAMLFAETDPGLPEVCARDCPYLQHCQEQAAVVPRSASAARRRPGSHVRLVEPALGSANAGGASRGSSRRIEVVLDPEEA